MAKTLNKSREHIIINQDTIVKPHQIKNFRELLKLRCKKTPIAQILGYKEFYNTKFKINKSSKFINLVEKKKSTTGYILSESQVDAILELKLQRLTAIGLSLIHI